MDDELPPQLYVAVGARRLGICLLPDDNIARIAIGGEQHARPIDGLAGSGNAQRQPGHTISVVPKQDRQRGRLQGSVAPKLYVGEAPVVIAHLDAFAVLKRRTPGSKIRIRKAGH